MNIANKIYAQFGHPRGLLGCVAARIMLHRGSNQERTLWGIKQLDIRPEDTVLEIGFGPGYSIEIIKKNYSCQHFLGVDHSVLMVQKARKRLKKLHLDINVQLLCQEISELREFPNIFDKVLTINSFQFWEDKIKTLQTIKKNMSLGGMMAIVFQPRAFGAQQGDTLKAGKEIESMMQSVGFKSIEVTINEDLKPIPGVCVLGKNESMK